MSLLGLQHYECTECGLSVNSLAQLQQHFKGRKHINQSLIYHKANMPSIARTDDSKSTGSTLAPKSINISKLGHQNFLNKTKQYAMGHVLATVVPQYNSKNKVMKKYPSKVTSDSSNMALVAASQMEATKSVHLGSVNISQKQKEKINSQWHSKDSNENITNKLTKDASITSFDYNHRSITQYSALHSQYNVQPSLNNFSIESILQTEYKSVNKTNDLNCIQKNSSELHMVAESINSVKLPCFPKSNDQHEHVANLNKEKYISHFKSSRFTEQNTKPVISVRKDLINTVDSSKKYTEHTDIKSIKHVGQSSNQAHLQTMGASIFKSKIPSQDAKLVYELNSDTQTSQIECTPLISAPLAPLDNKNHISMQNITNIPPSFVSTLKMKKVDESLKCYTCKKVVLDSAGKSLSLIYDHLFFGRASCKKCSKKVSCSGFSKLKQGKSNCCKPDQLVYSNTTVYYLIGELDNCDKNPRYYLAEYMMKLKLLWIYGPWHQAIVECKKFIKNPYEIPSYIFKGWDENLSPKQTTSFKWQKENSHTEEMLFEDKEIQKENVHIEEMLFEDKEMQKENTLTGREPLKDKETQKVKTDTGRELLKIKEIQENDHTGREPLKNKEIQKVNAPTRRKPKKDKEIQKGKAHTGKETLNEKLIQKPLKDKDMQKVKTDTGRELLKIKEIQENDHTGREPLKNKEIQKVNAHTGMEPIKDKEIQKEKAHTGKETLKNKGKVKTIKKEYKSIKRSLTDADDEENQIKNLSPPAKKSKSALRIFRIKEEVIDISSENCDSSGINCTEPNNESKTDLDCVLDEVIEFFGHMQKEDETIFPNCATYNQKQSKDFTVNNETFAPKIIEVCSIKNLENTFTSHVDKDVDKNYELEKGQLSFNAKENMKDNTNNTSFHSGQYDETVIFDNSILEQSCGSTIMTPDASPVNNTKLAAAPMLSMKNLSSSLTKLNSFQGNISVSKYIKDVSMINSNCLVSLKTIEECPMCYIKLSISKMTVNTNNLVLKFVCTCDLQIHILPNVNGKVVWPFTDKEYKPSECVQRRDEKVPKKRQLLLSYFFR